MLWLLRYIEDLPQSDDPWLGEWATALGFVVRAETPDAARDLAQRHSDKSRGHDTWKRWLNAKYSTCVEVPSNGPNKVILCEALDR